MSTPRGAGDLSQFTLRDARDLSGCVIAFNDPSVTKADFWIVVEGTHAEDSVCAVPDGRLVYATAESSWPSDYFCGFPERREFLRQFDATLSPHITGHPISLRFPPVLPSMINANHGPEVFGQHKRDVNWLSNSSIPSKTGLLSIILSDKRSVPGHSLRLKFAHAAQKYFGEDLVWFGNGINPIATKWEGLAPFRFSIVLENAVGYDLITEKLPDAFLAFAFPFYWGAPNCSAYFPSQALVSINVEYPRSALQQIRRHITGELDSSAVAALHAARRVSLRRWNYPAQCVEAARRVVALLPEGRVRLRQVKPCSLPAAVGWGNRLGQRRRAFAKRSSAYGDVS